MLMEESQLKAINITKAIADSLQREFFPGEPISISVYPVSVRIQRQNGFFCHSSTPARISTDAYDALQYLYTSISSDELDRYSFSPEQKQEISDYVVHLLLGEVREIEEATLTDCEDPEHETDTILEDTLGQSLYLSERLLNYQRYPIFFRSQILHEVTHIVQANLPTRNCLASKEGFACLIDSYYGLQLDHDFMDTKEGLLHVLAQQVLIDAGLHDELEVSGVYDPVTIAGVEAVRRTLGLSNEVSLKDRIQRLSEAMFDQQTVMMCEVETVRQLTRDIAEMYQHPENK